MIKLILLMKTIIIKIALILTITGLNMKGNFMKIENKEKELWDWQMESIFKLNSKMMNFMAIANFTVDKTKLSKDYGKITSLSKLFHKAKSNDYNFLILKEQKDLNNWWFS